MDFLTENWILILMAVTSGALLMFPTLQKGAGGISTNDAVQLINHKKGVLVDVGEPNEFAAGHAIGARNIPFGQLPDAKGLPGNKALPVVLLCPSGARAGRAAALLRKAGYESAVAVSGGTRAWREANLPVEKSA